MDVQAQAVIVYAIAATHKESGQRLLIKVSSLATRDQLSNEVARMNAATGRKFYYTLTTEGALI